MSISLTFAFANSKKNVFNNCFSVLSLDHKTGQQVIKGFKRGNNLKQLFETFVIPFITKTPADNIEIIFKSRRVAKSFSEKHAVLLSQNWKIKSLEGMQILKLENSNFDETALHAILLESLSTEYIDISGLTKTDKEILADLVTNIDEALTQSLLVGIAKEPKVYNFSFPSNLKKKYDNTQQRYS